MAKKKVKRNIKPPKPKGSSAKKMKQKQKQIQTVNIKIGGTKEQKEQQHYPTVVSNTHYVPQQTNNENLLLHLINSVKEQNKPLPIPSVFANKIDETSPHKSLLNQATEPISPTNLFDEDISNILDDETKFPIENNEHHITHRKKKAKRLVNLVDNNSNASMAIAVPIDEENLRPNKVFNKPKLFDETSDALIPDTENTMVDPFNGVLSVHIREDINQMFGNDEKKLNQFIKANRSQFVNSFSNMRRPELIKLHHMASETKMS